MEKQLVKIRISIEAGYLWGSGLSVEKRMALYRVWRRIFEQLGYIYENPDGFGSAPIAWGEDGAGFYLHPMEITGRSTPQQYEALVEALDEYAKREDSPFKVREARIESLVFSGTDEEYIEQVLRPHEEEARAEMIQIIDKAKEENDLSSLEYRDFDIAMDLANKYGMPRPYKNWGVHTPGTCSDDTGSVFFRQLWQFVLLDRLTAIGKECTEQINALREQLGINTNKKTASIA